jgi:hypothetical protein
MLNTSITSQEHRLLWSTPGWLPEEIGIIVEQGQFFCYEGEDLKLHLQRGIHNITVYSLIGMAINIESGQTQKSHLVSMVNGVFDFCFVHRKMLIDPSRTRRAGRFKREPVAFIQRFPCTLCQHRGGSHIQYYLEGSIRHRLSSQGCE